MSWLSNIRQAVYTCNEGDLLSKTYSGLEKLVSFLILCTVQ